MRRSELVTLSIVVVLLILSGYFTYVYTKKTAEPSAADAALTSDDETVQFTDLDGNDVDLRAHAGKVRVVNMWASWTPFSMTELPLLSRVALSYADDEVVFLAINRNESNVQAKSFIQHIENPEGVLFVQDPSDSLYKSIGGYAMPETVVYDQAGALVLHKRGTVTESELRAVIDHLLAAQ